ncbi:MAG TPA: helix-turn-helix domain-containing protein, partial [Clostridia bacterium]|nr:helix-turn-helix domain-containing protein [Clostridia bacterium]
RASIANAVKYLRECPLGEASQDAVARRVNMSRGYFSHCFKEVMGVSFAEFLRDLRVERSRQLLAAHPTRPVYWVAEKMGFRDEKYFSRFFKEHTGMLPTEYRRQQHPQHTNPKP